MLALFPGQGSQYVGMGKDLVQNFGVARQAFEEASDAIGVNLSKLCFEGPESDLMLTENTQPCLLAHSIATFRVAVIETGVRTSRVAGHSLGEYSALVASGSLGLAQAAKLVRLRGQLMQKAVPAGEGTMAAILGLEDAQVTALCERATEVAISKQSGESSGLSVRTTVEPANFNAPGQTVVAGSKNAVGEIPALLTTDAFKGGKCIPLSVSAPFHCSLMKPARDGLSSAFLKVSPDAQPKSPIFPYVPNRTARSTQEASVVFDLLMEQLDHPVLWTASMNHCLEQGHAKAIEFGPGRVLQGLMKRIAKAAGQNIETVSIGDPAGIKSLEAFIK